MSDAPAVEGPNGISQVIRPAAVVPEIAARKILVQLAVHDVRNGGRWKSQPNMWSLYDRPWLNPLEPGSSQMIGVIHIAYGAPTKYEITLYRVQVTKYGTDLGWTVESVTDEALAHGSLTLMECPRADLASVPQPFRF